MQFYHIYHGKGYQKAVEWRPNALTRQCRVRLYGQDRRRTFKADVDPTKSPLSSRLADMTDELTPQQARSAIKDADFSPELKQRLLDRISHAAYQPKDPVWTGTETLPQGVHRMLEDAKPMPLEMRKKSTMRPNSARIPVDMRISPKPKPSVRLAQAREQTSLYARANSAAEREEMRKMLRERFTSGARPMPNSIQGLTALANERIEDAIGRGQFKNIQRGKGINIETEYNANSPFLDTTEYLMNKMIQKQEIVPPWIEKQQELHRAVHVFRSRLRADWKRHVARSISSQGGSLTEQMQRAEQYATLEGLGEAQGFRDEEYMKTERAYHELSIQTINNLTRSYNLQAPDIAKKPYYSLERELQRCYTDVAPLVALEIRQRALEPPKRVVQAPMLGGSAVVHDDQRPHYGLRQLWRDLWRDDRVL